MNGLLGSPLIADLLLKSSTIKKKKHILEFLMLPISLRWKGCETPPQQQLDPSSVSWVLSGEMKKQFIHCNSYKVTCK